MNTDTITHAEQRRALYRAIVESDLPAPTGVAICVTDGEQHGTIRLADDSLDAVDEWAMVYNAEGTTWGSPCRPQRGERFPFRPFRTYSTNVVIAGMHLDVLTHVHDVPGGAR